MLIYTDSGIIIYFLDHVGSFQIRACTALARIAAAGDEIVLTDLTRLEYRVGPLKRRDIGAVADYDRFAAHPGIRSVPLTPVVYDRAAELRAQFGFKTPDALHLAAAIVHGCDRFPTNDNRLDACTAIPIEVLP
jgi:predicted nucleic acid-binding protein